MRTPERDDSLASATKALADALNQFTKSIGTGVVQTGTAVTRETSSQLSSSLHEAARSLSEASASIVSRTADPLGTWEGTTGRDRRRERALATREKLLAAARRLFAARGYEGASVADIAREAGMTKGALYANFASKEELFGEIARELSEQDDAQLAAADPAALATLLTQCTPEAGAPEAAEADGDLSDTLERTLLGLESWTYAVRHEEARAGFGAGVTHTLERIARMVAQRAGRTEPTERDADVALGLVSLQTIGQIFGTILGQEDIAPPIARLTRQLLQE